ncbi:MAG TPA: TIGR03767 family metallophosphoesterase [Mycobacteriales bacterium]|nr:TIGR03767 family metallophosphoesterase [Mycobacteriales bacterium]
MRPTRRDVLRSGLVVAAAAASPAYFPPRRAEAAAVRVAGTTLESTILRTVAAPNAGGYRLLVAGRGEPHLTRTDLKVRARPGRAVTRVPLVAFVHLTDLHVLDAQSPTRVEFLDRYEDERLETGVDPLFDAAYRPQEIFTGHLVDAVVRGARKVRRGPVTGRALEFAICTGDNIDNAQYNELRQCIAILDGAVVTTDSGDPSRWEGVHDQDPTTYDVHYWHPEGTPSSATVGADDNARRFYGFPTVPGLLDAVRRPFRATGIGMPWYAVFGNHDPLVQGNLAPNPVIDAIAVGGTKVVGLPAGATPGDVQLGISRGDPGALAAALTAGPARPVTADPDRRHLSRPEIMAEHFITAGTPVGHGWSREHVAADRAYYAFDHGLLRCVVLDTCHPVGPSTGSIDRTQLEWLRAELTANSRSSGGARDRLVIVFSHHNVAKMTNRAPDPTRAEDRVLGSELVANLLEFPNVIAWVNGHEHKNIVTPRLRGAGGGFWEIVTASHIDFPIQSRLIEITDNRDGTLSIFTTMVDADAPLTYGGRLDSPRSLASLGREIGANDWQERASEIRRGAVEARNVELLVAAPFTIPRAGRGASGLIAPRVPEPLPATGPQGSAEVVAAALAVAAAGLAAAARRERSGDLDDVGR